MRIWLEKIREKPEGVRRLLTLFFFCAIGGGVFFVWYLTERLSDNGLAESLWQANRTAENELRRFQNFRARLGEIKQKLNETVQTTLTTKKFFNSLSSYELETVGDQKPKEEPLISDIPLEKVR